MKSTATTAAPSTSQKTQRELLAEDAAQSAAADSPPTYYKFGPLSWRLAGGLVEFIDVDLSLGWVLLLAIHYRPGLEFFAAIGGWVVTRKRPCGKAEQILPLVSFQRKVGE